MDVLARLRHVDEAHVAAVPRDLRRGGRGDASHGGAIGVRIRRAQLQFVEGRRHAQAGHRAGGRVDGGHVLHPARCEADVAHDAAHRERMRRAGADAQEHGLADRHAGELEAGALDDDRVLGRRPAARVGLEARHRPIGEVVQHLDLGRHPAGVALQRSRQHPAAARRGDAGQAADVLQQGRVDAVDAQGGRDGQAAEEAHRRRAPHQRPAVQDGPRGDQADDHRHHHQDAARAVASDVAPDQAQAGVRHGRPPRRRRRRPA